MDEDFNELEITTNSDNESEVQLTSGQVLEMMEEAWSNEKFAPEILPNKMELVDCLLGQISYMEENLNNLSSSDFKKSIHQMELDRIRYLATSYLRNRLVKIETYVFDTLKREQERQEKGESQYLTDAELQFAKNYKDGLEQHFENVTNFYPGVPTEDWRSHPVVPNMDSFVFLKAKNAVEGVVVDDGTDRRTQDERTLPGNICCKPPCSRDTGRSISNLLCMFYSLGIN